MSKKIPAKKAATKVAAKVAKKTPAKKVATPKPAAKKTPAKKVPAVKKPVAKKQTGQVSAAPSKSTLEGKPSKSAKVSTPEPKAKATRSDRPIESDRPTAHGVQRPHSKTIAGALWAILDGMQKKLNRAPARFEFRAEIERLNKEDVRVNYADNSVSFQYFKWRTFNGIKGREVGLYPKRNSFELSVPIVRTPRAPKVAPAPAPASTPAPAKKAAVKVAAKKTAPVAKKAVATKQAAKPLPAVSSRLSKISETAPEA